MPKKILEPLVKAICRDIQTNYRIHDRYRSVREIADTFGASLATAHKAIGRLKQAGMVRARQKAGIFITSLEPESEITGKKVLVVSNNSDPRFNAAFLNGILRKAGQAGITVDEWNNPGMQTQSLDFGRALMAEATRRGSDAVIALYFQSADLPFYYLLSQGIDIITDITLDRVREVIPSVQTDNRHHAEEIARRFHAWKKKQILAVSFWEEDNIRFQHFKEKYMQLQPNGDVSFVHLGNSRSVGRIYQFLLEFSPECGVFSVDYSANRVIAPHFYEHRIPAEKNLLLYDCEEETFTYKGISPIRPVAPSLRQIGMRIMEKLIHKMKTGQWEEPLNELI